MSRSTGPGGIWSLERWTMCERTASLGRVRAKIAPASRGTVSWAIDNLMRHDDVWWRQPFELRLGMSTSSKVRLQIGQPGQARPLGSIRRAERIIDLFNLANAARLAQPLIG